MRFFNSFFLLLVPFNNWRRIDSHNAWLDNILIRILRLLAAMLLFKKINDIWVIVLLCFIRKWYFFRFIVSLRQFSSTILLFLFCLNLINKLFNNIVLSLSRRVTLLFLQFFKVHRDHIFKIILIEQGLVRRYLFMDQSIEIIRNLLKTFREKRLILTLFQLKNLIRINLRFTWLINLRRTF